MDNISIKNDLIDIFAEEKRLFKKMLNLLERQNDYILKQDLFNMEKIVEEINSLSVEIARAEIKKKNILKGQTLKDIVYRSRDDELQNNYRELRRIANSLMTQKETNELLIRQGINFTSKMLKIFNPARNNKSVYNARGKLTR